MKNNRAESQISYFTSALSSMHFIGFDSKFTCTNNCSINRTHLLCIWNVCKNSRITEEVLDDDDEVSRLGCMHLPHSQSMWLCAWIAASLIVCKIGKAPLIVAILSLLNLSNLVRRFCSIFIRIVSLFYFLDFFWCFVRHFASSDAFSAFTIGKYALFLFIILLFVCQFLCIILLFSCIILSPSLRVCVYALQCPITQQQHWTFVSWKSINFRFNFYYFVSIKKNIITSVEKWTTAKMSNSVCFTAPKIRYRAYFFFVWNLYVFAMKIRFYSTVYCR